MSNPGRPLRLDGADYMSIAVSPHEGIEVPQPQNVSSPAASGGRAQVTLRDVALRAGANVASVSVVLNGSRSTGGIATATRDRILTAAAELGYRVNPHAQRLSTGRCQNTISIYSLDLSFSSAMPKVQTIQHLLSQEGYDAALHGYGNYSEIRSVRQTELMANLRQLKPRAIVCSNWGLNAETVAEMHAYTNEGGIIITFDHPMEAAWDQVVFDRVHNTYAATRHLLESGHRKIGLFVPGPKSPVFNERYVGFKRALDEYEGVSQPEWMWFGMPESGGAEAARCWLELPASDRPTAVCLVNDYAALTFVSILQQAGVEVPGDVSVVGHDDAEFGKHLAVPLTTVSHPMMEIAESVFELLQERLKGNHQMPPRQKVIRGELKVRATVSPPK